LYDSCLATIRLAIRLFSPDKKRPALKKSTSKKDVEKPAAVNNAPALFSNSLWGVELVKSDTSEWSQTDCPKCHKKSIMVHQSGPFFCASCAYHGNVSVQVQAYRGAAVTIWNLFLTYFSTKNPSIENEFTELGIPGCLAPAWSGDTWIDAWHSWCLDADGDIVDAVISSGPGSYARYHWTKPMPMGWSDMSGSRAVLCLNIKNFLVLKKSGVANVVAMPVGLSSFLPTAKEWDVLQVIEKKMNALDSVVIVSSKNDDERALEDELGRRLGREKCHRVRWCSPGSEILEEEMDAEASLTAYGEKALNLMVACAPPFPVVGIHELDDISDKFEQLYTDGYTPGATTGYPTMDEYYTVKPGQWTSVTGIPGHGKSTFLDALCVNLAATHGWRIGMFSPENQPIERHFASLMEKYIGKPFSLGSSKRISPDEKNSAKRWLNDRFKTILPDEENGVWTLDAVLNLAKILVYRYGIRGLVIDPWNEIDHSSSQSREVDYISESLTKIRRFARLYDVHVWVVAHPTKLELKADGRYPVPTPYNISGGAQWRNKADNCITVYRHVGEADGDVVDIHIQKIRFKEIGRVGRISLRSDPSCGRYIDDIDQSKREISINKGLHAPSSAIRIKNPRTYDNVEYKVLSSGSPLDDNIIN